MAEKKHPTILKPAASSDFGEAIKREWLETNGVGGWASSTVINAHTRRYHGLLVAAIHPPVGRIVLLSRLEETLMLDGSRIELSTNVYPGAVHPQGYRYIQRFSRNFFPSFTYVVDDLVLKKTVAAIHGENTTVIIYEMIETSKDIRLELRPFMAGRDYHGLTRANDNICRESHFSDNVWSYQPYEQLPTLYMLVPQGNFQPSPEWYYNYQYLVEKQRGLDFQEDLFTPGLFTFSLRKGDRLGIIVSTENPAGRDAQALAEREKKRRKDLLAALPVSDEMVQTLTLAADQFIVRRGDDLKTIIAGYHWFTDWGRDTMIALPGLALVTRRYSDAKKILQAFAENIDRGMLPNRFPDADEKPEYNTVDAGLWFFVAAYKYYLYTKDHSFLEEILLPALAEIVDWHQRGTRHGIHMEDDGLLAAGAPGEQLTWMDAKIGDWVVTPRSGKAVEINALWYNALAIYEHLLNTVGRKEEAHNYQTLSRTVLKNFIHEFWYADGGYLLDVVDDDRRDYAVRPNQILAVSLPFALLGRNRARQVLNTVERHLLTPLGLRSLSPQHQDYNPTYQGDACQRDSAYHQGTVWAWLLGPYLTALVRIRGKTGRKQGLKLMQAVKNHLSESGLGQVSEIFDGDAPHAPRGCIAQAWSVAEIMRAYTEDILGESPGKDDLSRNGTKREDRGIDEQQEAMA